MKNLKITGSEKEFLDVDLTDILSCLIDIGPSTRWVMSNVRGTGIVFGETIQAFERIVKNSPGGLRINWDMLLQLSREVNQIIDVKLIGIYRETNSIDQISNIYKEFIIECVDSSYWLVSSEDRSFYTRFEALKGIELTNEEPQF